MLAPCASTRQLVDAVWDELHQTFGPSREAIRTAQFRLSADDFFGHIGRLRKRLYTSPKYHAVVAELMGQFGFRPVDHSFDPIRLRVIPHMGHKHPAAQPMYYGHRDTWYSNPQTMITWWIPLHDVQATESFDFYPDEFERPVANDSEIFDFDMWTADGQQRRIGWQDAATGLTALYPQLREPPQGARLPVTSRAGELLLFSAQHLHRTRANVTGKTRFSLDFRTVHLLENQTHAGPPNVDNRSTGCSLKQFVTPGEV